MSKVNFFILIFIFVASILIAQQKSLLWKIQSPDQKETSYLFGTIHLIDSSNYHLSDSVQSILGRVQTLTLEIYMSKENGMAALMSSLDKIMMSVDTTLETLLTKEDYKLLSQKLEKNGIPVQFLNKFKPIFIYVLLTQDGNPTDIGKSYKSYELELTKMAEEQKKNFAGLESADFQLSVLNKIPTKEQAEMLVAALREEEKSDTQFEKMLEVYKKEDVEAMEQMMKDDPNLLKYNSILLTDRNKAWIPKIKEMMHVGSNLFAVGAGHLGGKEGVINLLRQEGYRVTPIFQDKQKKK